MKKVLLTGIIALAMVSCCNKAAEGEQQENACAQQEQCCKQDSTKCCKNDSAKCCKAEQEVKAEVEVAE